MLFGCHFELARNLVFRWLNPTNLLPGVSPRAIHIEPFQGLNTETGALFGKNLSLCFSAVISSLREILVFGGCVPTNKFVGFLFKNLSFRACEKSWFSVVVTKNFPKVEIQCFF